MASPSLHDRMYRWLLRAFPAEFRGDFGDQMTEDFRDQRAEAVSRRSLARIWLRTTVDIVRRAPREHLDVLVRDAGYAVRLFRRRRGMTACALITLAIGIGLNAAAFSVLHGVLWRRLPLPQSDRLVRLYQVAPLPPNTLTGTSPANFLDWERETRTLEAVAIVQPWYGLTIVLQGGAEDLTGAAVSRSFFPMLPVRPVLGRLLEDADYEAPTAVTASHGAGEPAPKPRPTVMVISHDLWQRQFGGRSDVIGQLVDLGRGREARVIGVAPRDFEDPFVPESAAWFPEGADVERVSRRAAYLPVLGRLAPNVTIAEAQAEFDVIASRLAAAYPRANASRGIRVVPLLDSVTAGVRSQLWFLFATAGCVLLIAGANVSNLLLALSAGRQREFATRVAVGASRAHLVRQTVTEGLALAAAGGAAGFLLAKWVVPALASVAPRSIPRLDSIDVGEAVFAFTAIVSLAIGLVSGLAAATAAGRARIDSPLRAAGAAGRAGRRFRQALIVGEVAVALMLTVAATLLVQTVRAVMALPLGFKPANVIAIGLSQDANGRTKADFDSQFVTAIRSLPGVVAAGVGGRPLGGSGLGTALRRPEDPGQMVTISVDAVSTGYLEALGARLATGRFFTSDDREGAPRVALVNEAAVRQHWPGGALGRTFLDGKHQVTIVGVLADIRYKGLEEDPQPILYLPDLQAATFWTNTVLIRTTGNPRDLLPALRTLVKSVDPKLPVSRVETLEERLAAVLAPRRFTLWLVGLFSIIALVLAVVGLYGLISESVGQRVPEIGVRMALGATAASVVALILRQGGMMIAIGVVLGVGGALAINGVMSSFVFGVRTTDAVSYVTAAVGLLAVTFAACLVPARRAARIDPVVALRQE